MYFVLYKIHCKCSKDFYQRLTHSTGPRSEDFLEVFLEVFFVFFVYSRNAIIVGITWYYISVVDYIQVLFIPINILYPQTTVYNIYAIVCFITCNCKCIICLSNYNPVIMVQ